jgi:hypothetical protein
LDILVHLDRRGRDIGCLSMEDHLPLIPVECQDTTRSMRLNRKIQLTRSEDLFLACRFRHTPGALVQDRDRSPFLVPPLPLRRPVSIYLHLLLHLL